ncbi:hypothetical protein A3F66_03205 [candidate division TM6 bacterium RIFCSPHIGHO2_12_FULL_32_22]|nr:MAG: hypothetical protein A3F66_03205 [candidate division TM6 bacterium RIFCSPHIGHO2_12_FULL_32_22]
MKKFLSRFLVLLLMFSQCNYSALVAAGSRIVIEKKSDDADGDLGQTVSNVINIAKKYPQLAALASALPAVLIALFIAKKVIEGKKRALTIKYLTGEIKPAEYKLELGKLDARLKRVLLVERGARWILEKLPFGTRASKVCDGSCEIVYKAIQNIKEALAKDPIDEELGKYYEYALEMFSYKMTGERDKFLDAVDALRSGEVPVKNADEIVSEFSADFKALTGLKEKYVNNIINIVDINPKNSTQDQRDTMATLLESIQDQYRNSPEFRSVVDTLRSLKSGQRVPLDTPVVMADKPVLGSAPVHVDSPIVGIPPVGPAEYPIDPFDPEFDPFGPTIRTVFE